MLLIFTIVKNGSPFIQRQLPIFEALTIPWQWVVVEGYAQPVKDTSWCKPMPEGVSTDGTHEFLVEAAKRNPNVTHIFQSSWPGKVSMCNAALNRFQQRGIIFEVDCDEFYTTAMIETIYNALSNHPTKNAARFHAKYFVGPGLILKTDGCYGNRFNEWLRMWKFSPGMRWGKHEPPVLEPMVLNAFSPKETLAMGIEMTHYAYVMESQVAQKELYYGYAGAVDQWRRLQANTIWPCHVGHFLKWVTDDAICERIKV